MSKHTPGPWYAIPKGSNREEACAMYRIDNKPNAPWENFGQIAYAHKHDAFLIAAAPLLLEALEAMYKMFENIPQLEQPCFDQPPEPVSQWDYEAMLVLGDAYRALAEAKREV